MEEKNSLALAHELFQLIKRIPRLNLTQKTIGGLTRSEHELLVILLINFDDDTRALTVSEISSLLQITPAGVTHLINPLEQAGYIKRLGDPNDRRVVLIGLTDKGSRAANTLIADIQEHLIGLFNHLGEEDSMIFVHLMSRVLEYFEGQLIN